MRKSRLFTPGPTPLIPEAQLAMALPMPHHRTTEFSRIMADCRKKLQSIFKTENELLILSTTGTGAMEAAVSNFHSPGEKVLVISVGKFGERWSELAESFSLDCQILKKSYGDYASAEEIVTSLRQNAGTKSLFIQACETSTGTVHDLERISSLVRESFPDILIIVDAITAIGCQELPVDQWDLDVVVCGSQKSFGIPPGLSFISLSERALIALRSNPGKNFYHLSLLREMKGQAQGSPAFTPSIALVMALQKACSQILQYGLDRTIGDAAQMAAVTRSGLESLGFRILSQSPANAVTAAIPPEGIAADDIKNRLDEWYGIKVAGGQGDVAGQIIRIAHLGYFDILDVFTLLSALELTLVRMGREIPAGTGVQAAMQQLYS